MYSHVKDNNENSKTAKGIEENVIKKDITGADPGFFLGSRGCTSKEWCHWRWGKQILEKNTKKKASSQWGGGVRTSCTLPLDPPLHQTQRIQEYTIQNQANLPQNKGKFI